MVYVPVARSQFTSQRAKIWHEWSPGGHQGFPLFEYPDIRFWIFRIFSLYGHNIDPRLMEFDMNDLQSGVKVFHYPDIRISDFGFFRIFSFSDIFTLRPHY